MRTPRAGRVALVVRDSDLFPGFDKAGCVDGFVIFVAIPAIVSIRKTTMVDEANGRVYSTNHRVRATRQSVGFDNTAERVLAREIIVKGKELPLLGLR